MSPGLDTTRSRSSHLNTRVIPPNEGALTAPLIAQKRFFKECISDGLFAGLAPAEAVRRAADVLAEIHNQALVSVWDSEQQWNVKLFVRGIIRAGGNERGFNIAMRAVEASRLCTEQIDRWRAEIKRKDKKGVVP